MTKKMAMVCTPIPLEKLMKSYLIQGEWMANKKHGKGTWFYVNKDKFEVQFYSG